MLLCRKKREVGRGDLLWGGIYVMQISVFGYPAKDGGVMGGVLGVRVCFFVFVYVVVVGGLACLEKRGEESWKEWWMHGGCMDRRDVVYLRLRWIVVVLYINPLVVVVRIGVEIVSPPTFLPS